MKYSSFFVLFKLLFLLTENKGMTVPQLAEKMDITTRSVYRYLEQLEQNGIIIIKEGRSLRVDSKSPFFHKMGYTMPFSDTEAEMVCRILATVDDSNKIALAAKDKLVRYYGLASLASPDGQEKRKKKIDIINEAMVKKQMLLIKGYSSPHSQTKKDRIVEPFLLMNDDMDLRCNEVGSHMNKTFKVSRMDDVEILDTPWINESEHKKIYTDLFAFSGEEVHHIKIIMGQLSHNLMLEEHPRSARYFTEQESNRWLFETDVVSYLGIGRFILGLYDDIEILSDEGLKMFIKDKIQKMLGK